jgi:anhydro-N-acetylmuramic acid kinase
MSLLDMLVERLTDGEEAFDPGGRYAVQGRRVQELIDHWLADPYLRRPLPRWHPRGVRPERFLLEAVQMAVERGWSIRDLLCSATHFIAESVGLAVHLRMPSDLAVDQIILTGGGRHNGMLLRELGAVFPGLPLLPIEDIGIEAEALGPACYGLLALFYLDQVPANRPEVTGADLCRVLGRLTPGSPQSWQRLVAEMADARPTVRPLRSAL